MWPRNIARDSLSKLIVPGFHVFRRFRLTNLREAGVPGDIERFWMGHADKTIGDRYSFRKLRLPIREGNGWRRCVLVLTCHLYPMCPKREKST